MTRLSRLFRCLIVVPLLMVGGCSIAAPSGEDRALQQARDYFRQADRASTPQRQALQLQAIAILVQSGYTLQAKNALSEIDTRGLADVLIYRKQLLHAELALIDQAPDSAILALAPIPLTAPTEVLRPRQALLLRAYEMQGDEYNALQLRLAEEGKFADSATNADNLRRIARLFERLDAQYRNQEANRQALETRQHQVLAQWREWALLHPQFAPPRDAAPPPATRATTGPQHITVMLPLTGRYASAGTAIRDGIVAAHQAQAAPRAKLTVVDTGDDPLLAQQRYQEAIHQGTDFIIGPLQKELITTLTENAQLRVPTLVLNTIGLSARPATRFYQFGLTPEQEAVQVAQRAWRDGLRRTMIFTPDSAWGQRLGTAFAEAWRQLGGQVVADHCYGADQTDFSALIQGSLLLGASEKRRKTLERTLGQKLETTPRHRRDVDFIFLAANPRQAHLWRPQLNFLFAGDIAIYSTSHVFGGVPNERDDRDSEGIIFGDMPWVLDRREDRHPLRNQLAARPGTRDDQFSRLFAFGVDAYHIATHLATTPDRLDEFDGETGVLTLAPNGQILRGLSWAQFRAGLPEPYPTVSQDKQEKDDHEQSNR